MCKSNHTKEELALAAAEQYEMDHSDPEIVQVIGFTLSPDSTMFTREYVLTKLNAACEGCATFSIFPEVTASGQLHYHGIIRIKKKRKWFSQKQIFIHGTNMKPRFEFKLSAKWYRYIIKDQ